jgi:serine phosphatase RsbU (regulator of sigma subunit)
MAAYIVHDEHGRPLEMSDVPSVKLLRGEPAEPLLMHTVNRRTGQSRWELLKTAPLRDGQGNLTAAVTVIEDLTAVKTAEVHMRLLSEAGRVLASTLDLEQTLQNVAELAVPAFADWCVVDLVDPALNRDHVAMAHRDPARRALVARLKQFQAPALDPESTVGRVVLSGHSERFFEVDEEHLERVAHDTEDLAIMRALEIRSAIVVPLQVRGRTVGVMTFCTAESQRRLTDDDLDLAEQLASRAALAVETARLHTTLSRVSETLQQNLIPNDPPELPGWELASLYQPAGAAQRIEVGGDFYEVFESGTAPIALIGDVTGHGVAAATLTAMMRYGARFASKLEPEPAAILRRLDEELRQHTHGALCTALCARLGQGVLVLSSAGHPPALVVDAKGEVTEAPSPGPLLGAFEDACWSEEEVSAGPGNLVLFYTDGVTETAGEHDRFGRERLRRLLAEHAGGTPQELVAALSAALEAFRCGDASDDVAALALRSSA